MLRRPLHFPSSSNKPFATRQSHNPLPLVNPTTSLAPLLSSLALPMDPNHNFSGGNGFQAGPRHNFGNANNLELFIQRQISQHEARSPGYREAYSSSCSGSPTPPATTHQQTTHQQTTSQPYPAAYYPVSPAGLPQSTSSPVSPQYALTADTNYSFDLNNLGILSAHGVGIGGSRNHATE